jgi:hypothetical protein
MRTTASLPRAEPVLEVAPVDDPEDEHDTVRVDDVIHDPVVAHAESMEFVVHAPQRLDALAADAPTTGNGRRQPFQRTSDAGSDLGRKLLERARRSGSERDAKRRQASSARSTVLPAA